MPQLRYPWTVWLDGQNHLLEQGVDFRTPTSRFLQQIRNAARLHNSKVSLRADRTGKWLSVLARPRPPRASARDRYVFGRTNEPVRAVGEPWYGF